MTPPVLYVKTPDAWPWLLPTFPRVSSSPRTTEPTLPARNMSGDAGTSWSTLAHASMSTALKNSNPTDPAGAFRKSTSAGPEQDLDRARQADLDGRAEADSPRDHERVARLHLGERLLDPARHANARVGTGTPHGHDLSS